MCTNPFREFEFRLRTGVTKLRPKWNDQKPFWNEDYLYDEELSGTVPDLQR